MIVANGSTNVTTYFVLRDSTNHAPKTDVTITDIDLYYVEELAAISTKVDATAHSAATDAHADGKAFNIGQGLYRIDWEDEAFNGGVGKKVTLIVVCSGVDTTFLEVELSPAVSVSSVGTGAINAAAIADGAIDVATFAADVGTTALASNPVAKAAAKGSWDSLRADHTTADTFGDIDTTADIADAIWDETSTGHTDAGKSGAQLWTDVDAILADTGTDGVVVASGSKTGYELSSTGNAAAADALLNRDMSTGTDSGSPTVRTVRQALRFLRNKWSISGTTLTVTKEDDTTPSWSAEVTTNASADPVTANDPASS